jgi:hypothetical protein
MMRTETVSAYGKELLPRPRLGRLVEKRTKRTHGSMVSNSVT